MPSAVKTLSSSALLSGSSSGSSRAEPSTTVTLVPKRANTWASSTPIAPPPRMTSDSGASVVSIASRLVQNGVPASPGIGGMAGWLPVLSTMPAPGSERLVADGDLVLGR